VSPSRSAGGGAFRTVPGRVTLALGAREDRGAESTAGSPGAVPRVASTAHEALHDATEFLILKASDPRLRAPNLLAVHGPGPLAPPPFMHVRLQRDTS
jgi:hypothetical protein